MELKCEKEQLLNAIHVVENAVSTKNTLPILSNILLEARDESLYLIGTDLELTIRNFFKTDVVSEGSITVSAKKISNIVKELPSGEVTLKVDNNVLIISCSSLLFKIKGLPKEEFPSFPDFKQDKTLNLKLSTLIDMINRTIYAVSNDEIRYVLNGLFFNIDKDVIKVVATDGHRLSFISDKIENEIEEPVSIIIPRKTLHELSRICGNLEDKDQNLEIKVSENQILFTLDSITVISRLIEGQFPDYEKVIPKDLENKVKINKNDFLRATRRVSLMSNATSAIKYSFIDDKLEIIAVNPEEGEAKENIFINDFKGEITMGYNYKYILDILKVINTDDVYIEFSKPLNPGLIRPIDNENFLNVIMPMKVDKL